MVRGRMGRRVSTANPGVSPQEMARMEERVKEMSEALAGVRARKTEAEDELLREERDLAGIRPQKQRVEMEMKALKDGLKKSEQNIRSQEEKVRRAAQDAGETEEKQAVVDEAKRAYEEVKAASDELREEVRQIDEAIKEISDRHVGLTKKSLEANKSEVKKAEKAIIQANAAATKAEREIDKCTEKIEGFNQEMEEAKEELDRIKAEMGEIEEIATKVLYDQKQLKKDKEAILTEIEELLESRKGMDEEAQNLEKRDLELKTAVEEKKKLVVDLDKQAKKWHKDFKNLKLHDLRVFKNLKPRSAHRRTPRGGDRDGGASPMEENDPDLIASTSSEAEELRDNSGGEGSDIDADSDVDDVEDTDGKLTPKLYSDEEIDRKVESEEWTLEGLHYLVTAAETALSGRGRPNLRAIEDFKKKELKYLSCVSELDVVTKRRDAHRDRYEELKKMRMNEFMTGFGVISTRLKEMYQMITLGGDAELELVDTMDPFSEGIQFSVRPPKKSWKQISNLSGGEKTLSSLALVFALHHFKPTPLYVMDEIDAALDFKNVSIVANYIKERTKNGQFIIISLRNNMFELADRLVGIYKTYNCTKHTVINPEKITCGAA